MHDSTSDAPHPARTSSSYDALADISEAAMAIMASLGWSAHHVGDVELPEIPGEFRADDIHPTRDPIANWGAWTERLPDGTTRMSSLLRNRGSDTIRLVVVYRLADNVTPKLRRGHTTIEVWKVPVDLANPAAAAARVDLAARVYYQEHPALGADLAESAVAASIHAEHVCMTTAVAEGEYLAAGASVGLTPVAHGRPVDVADPEWRALWTRVMGLVVPGWGGHSQSSGGVGLN